MSILFFRHLPSSYERYLILCIALPKYETTRIFFIINFLGRSKYVCPWLVLSVIMVLLESIYLLMMGMELITGSLNTQIFSLSTHISITIYFLLVVFSHYREMRLIESGAMEDGMNLERNKAKDPNP